jgi:hypothetical protein
MANSPLSTPFPPRVLKAPPTSGGFYKFSKSMGKEVDDDAHDIESKSVVLLGKEKIKPAAGNYRQFFKSQMVVGDAEEEKVELNVDRFDVDRRSPQPQVELEFNHFDRKRVAPGLMTSFSALMPPRKLINDSKSEETQTQTILLKSKFETLTDYQAWIQGQVDPFLAVSFFGYFIILSLVSSFV